MGARQMGMEEVGLFGGGDPTFPTTFRLTNAHTKVTHVARVSSWQEPIQYAVAVKPLEQQQQQALIQNLTNSTKKSQ